MKPNLCNSLILTANHYFLKGNFTDSQQRIIGIWAKQNVRVGSKRERIVMDQDECTGGFNA